MHFASVSSFPSRSVLFSYPPFEILRPKYHRVLSIALWNDINIEMGGRIDPDGGVYCSVDISVSTGSNYRKSNQEDLSYLLEMYVVN